MIKFNSFFLGSFFWGYLPNSIPAKLDHAKCISCGPWGIAHCGDGNPECNEIFGKSHDRNLCSFIYEDEEDNFQETNMEKK